jgi:hypothetical protein
LSRRRSSRLSLSWRPRWSSRRLLLWRREDDLSLSLLGHLGSSGARNALLNC